jgi:hypothetical protein
MLPAGPALHTTCNISEVVAVFVLCCFFAAVLSALPATAAAAYADY